VKIGMLWFDNDSKVELDTKLERAADYYRTKYGTVPTLCFVHPSMVPTIPNRGNGSSETEDDEEEESLITAGVEVRTTASVLPNHFWIGVNGGRKGANKRRAANKRSPKNSKNP